MVTLCHEGTVLTGWKGQYNGSPANDIQKSFHICAPKVLSASQATGKWKMYALSFHPPILFQLARVTLIFNQRKISLVKSSATRLNHGQNKRGYNSPAHSYRDLVRDNRQYCKLVLASKFLLSTHHGWSNSPTLLPEEGRRVQVSEQLVEKDPSTTAFMLLKCCAVPYATVVAPQD